jgi:hypothetical protein
MKHLGYYLVEKYGTADITTVDCDDEEYLEYVGWVQAIEEYEIDKQARAIVKAFNGK